MKEAGWVVEYREKQNKVSKWKLFDILPGHFTPNDVSMWLTERKAEVSVDGHGLYILGDDGEDLFRIRRQM